MISLKMETNKKEKKKEKEKHSISSKVEFPLFFLECDLNLLNEY